MATISIGFRSDLVFPVNGMTKSQAWATITEGLRWSCSRGPYCIAKQANITFVGSSRPHILVGNCNNPNAWAEARYGGYGLGDIRWSVHPKILTLFHAKWPTQAAAQQTINSLFAHEVLHVILATADQSVALPLSPKWRARLVDHYGPVPRQEARVLDELDDVPEAVQSRWWLLWARKIVTPVMGGYSKCIN